MHCIGNDIVDLTFPGNTGKSRDGRFVNRVFTDAEKAIISKSPRQDGMLWALWAAKEAAYKAAVKACRGIPSAPRGYEVEIHAGGREGWLSGCVKTPAGIAGVCLHLGTDYVHCLGGFFSDGSLDSVLWTVEEMDAESAQEPGYESVFVRTIAGRYLSSVIGTDASAISVISRDEASIPSLRIGGRESSIDISLSHDGRFAAAAFMM